MYLDTGIFYALIKKSGRHAEFAKKIISKTDNKYTSTITVLELEILIKREISPDLSKHTLELFREKFPKTKILAFDEKTYLKSQELRKKFDLGIFDSVHAATSLLKDKKIASTDTAYDRIKGIKRTGQIN